MKSRLTSLAIAAVAIPLLSAQGIDDSALPAPAARPVVFEKDIKPLIEETCVKCHAKGKHKGGFSLETRAALLKGGETGAGAEIGRSDKSLIVEAVSGLDPDLRMPKKGSLWTPEQVGLLRAWIDQGAPWPDGITFAKPEPLNLKPRSVALLDRPSVHPIDQIVGAYFAQHDIPFGSTVDDHTFARRVYLDLIGLLPTPAQLDAFLQNSAPNKRAQLVRTLLDDRRNYAEHWLSFWNDLLRNDYQGTGFIDGGRKQISGWLYTALARNKPYDQFVAELVNPKTDSEGFTHGIIWRGNVPAAMLPPMQAAQNVSQVFLGVNLKCASCHDSFVNDWSLADAYGMAAIYADQPLEMIHCDKPTGEKAPARFLYAQLGSLDANAAKEQRMQRLADLLTKRSNGRLSRTIVNRLWARLFGRGIVEPLDDMEKPAFDPDLLDWLAEDLVTHDFDLQHTLETICTSRTYQLAAVEPVPAGDKHEFVFRGPWIRRLSAEQFTDAVSSITGEWAKEPSSLEFDFAGAGVIPTPTLPRWIWTDEPVELAAQRPLLRAAKDKLEAATQTVAQARTAADKAANGGAEAIEAARAELAAALAGLEAAGTDLAQAAKAGAGQRHRVIFRKSFDLSEVPSDAYATILASQRYDVFVNGTRAKPIAYDGFRRGRIALLNLQPLLKVGANVVVLEVESHTEKSMNEEEAAKFPASTMHLNPRSGVAFYARCLLPSGPIEWTTDDSWHVQRGPAGDYRNADFSDADWARPTMLRPDATPIDEGPGLPPITRQDFANIPVELGSQVSAAISTVTNTGHIRASLLAADPLQAALDRPNREVVVPVRATAATTIQALELTNGTTLDEVIKSSAAIVCPGRRERPGRMDEPPFPPRLQPPTERTGKRHHYRNPYFRKQSGSHRRLALDHRQPSRISIHQLTGRHTP